MLCGTLTINDHLSVVIYVLWDTLYVQIYALIKDELSMTERKLDVVFLIWQKPIGDTHMPR